MQFRGLKLLKPGVSKAAFGKHKLPCWWIQVAHNFLNITLATRLGLILKKNARFTLLVANGEKVSNMGKCHNIQVWLQGTLFVLEFYLIPLVDYDVVLGAQELRTLGPIIWDFSKLHMRFIFKNTRVCLLDMASPKELTAGYSTNV
jgi:hypothetical protein